MHEFEDLNYKFSIGKTVDKPQDLHDQFIIEMSGIDDVLIKPVSYTHLTLPTKQAV